MLFYLGNADDAVITNDLPTSYTFTPASMLQYAVAAYNIDGNFLGMKSVTGGLLQLCNDSEKKLDAAYLFGTVYSQLVRRVVEFSSNWDKDFLNSLAPTQMSLTQS